MAKSATTEIIEISPINIKRATIKIVGDSPLIVHAWSEKAKREMLEKQMRVAKTKARDAKNPVDDFIESLYWMTDKPTESTLEAVDAAIASGARFGFPVSGIKQSAVSAAFRSGALKNMTVIRGAFFIFGEMVGNDQLVEIKGGAPEMREDMVRVGMGTADIRYRAMFRDWSIDLDISYNAGGQIGLDQIVNAINIGGFSCGIGEWRPEKDGQYGMYHVVGT